MSQTFKRSTVESAVVTGIGLAYAVPINYLFFEHVHLESWTRAVALTALFTVLSFLLKLGARRVFEWIDREFPND